MSSTYAHYQAPASLPSDYAILSRFAGNRSEDDDEEDRIEPDGEAMGRGNASERVPSGSKSPRRRSFPTTYLDPQNPTMAAYGAHSSKPISAPLSHSTEITPLLNPLVPRILELNEHDDSLESKMKMFWEELRILTKYALPVFGSVRIHPINILALRSPSQNPSTRV